MHIMKEKTVCFTGHRPEKLPDRGAESSPRTRIIKSLLYNAILECVFDGCDTFITGMQRGVDLWAGEIIMELMPKYSLKLIAVYPYRDHGSNFRGKDKWILGRIAESATETIIISEKYTPACLHMRNKFMVDNSSRIIAVIDKMNSGTGKTLKYAQQCGLTADIISPDPEKDIDQLTLF
ncbi:MAG: SLOG family protein [Huintestinicola sp.]